MIIAKHYSFLFENIHNDLENYQNTLKSLKKTVIAFSKNQSDVVNMDFYELFDELEANLFKNIEKVSQNLSSVSQKMLS